MNIGASLLLGIVQGFTEFLPVSSSGHLVLGRALLPDEALRSPGVLFEIVVHLGTLAAALIYLRREVFGLLRSLVGAGGSTPEGRGAVEGGRRLIGLLLFASIPAAIVGVAFRDQIHHAFSGMVFAAGGLVLTGAVLLTFRRPAKDAANPSAKPRPPRASRASRAASPMRSGSESHRRRPSFPESPGRASPSSPAANAASHPRTPPASASCCPPR